MEQGSCNSNALCESGGKFFFSKLVRRLFFLITMNLKIGLIKTYRSARANPYAERMELYRWIKIVFMPRRLAISHAC